MHSATAMPSRKVAQHDETETVQMRLYKSFKIWSMYADLEEAVGTFKTCKSVYDSIIDLKIATPQIIINYGSFLAENGYFEEAFRAYEKGIALFKWSNVSGIWNTYLTKFLERYVPKTREIYVKAIDILKDENSREMSLRYAEMETKRGEVDRARAIYVHCSEICDPRVTSHFWQVWTEFEVRHGNEDTMREMLRIKRSVQAMYNTQINMSSAQMLNSMTNVQTPNTYIHAMCALNIKVEAATATAASGNNRANITARKDSIIFVRGITERGTTENAQVNNLDEININMDVDDKETDEDQEESEDILIEQRIIPSEVFGSFKKPDDGD
ncbi:hypothetical protein PV327_005088 [Microctonus hyperodae]|uniref:Pre-mRNA-splicing factor Syf1/CRNKL1-like C-terminal HAT-repeats domain-containing protein n=1 Tax=Microctonus hyperodae TaxID=165561 RepID=A0AA39G0N9_MICHY|nr:hypothetical protein PV327_005088 [Microctonus hyperodae]